MLPIFKPFNWCFMSEILAVEYHHHSFNVDNGVSNTMVVFHNGEILSAAIFLFYRGQINRR